MRKNSLNVKTSVRCAAALIASLCAGLFICVCTGDRNALKITFTGDIIMHIPVKTCARMNNARDEGRKASVNNEGFDHLFAEIAPRLSEADAAIGNMEFPVSPPFESKPFYFNCVPAVIPALKKAGFTMVSIANNHIIDQGPKGAIDTMGYLNRYGLPFIGAGLTGNEARAGRVVEMKGIRAGFLAYTGVINSAFPRPSSGVFLNDFHKREPVIEDIRAMRMRADFVALFVHAGWEYDMQPPTNDLALMREYIENGVDLVIAHHPHVLQRVDRYTAADGRSAFIFNSLGNFISNQSSEFQVGRFGERLGTRDSVMVRLYLNRKDGKIRQRFVIVPIRTSNEVLGPEAWRRNIQTVAINDEIRRLKKRIRSSKDPAAKRELAGLSARVAAMKVVLLEKGPFDEIEFEDAE